jgi:hypothetical protein
MLHKLVSITNLQAQQSGVHAMGGRKCTTNNFANAPAVPFPPQVALRAQQSKSLRPLSSRGLFIRV